MSVERIKDDVKGNNSSIDNKFADGEILYGADLNEITRILRTGINLNYLDITKLISSYSKESGLYSVYPSNLDLPVTNLVNGKEVFVMSYIDFDGVITEGIYLYKVIDNSWSKIMEISIKNLSTMINNFQLRLNNVETSRSGIKTYLQATQPIDFEDGDLWFDTTT